MKFGIPLVLGFDFRRALGSERVETEENFAFEVELGLTIKTARNTREKQQPMTRST